MKKILLALLVLQLCACTTNKTLKATNKVMKGTWVVSNIDYSEAGTFKVTLLNDTSKECFEGSTWRFIPNNNTGMYTIENEDCDNGLRNFVYTVQEVDAQTGLYDFLLKPTNEKNKSSTNDGFRLQLSGLSETDMQWKQTLSVDGKPFTITTNFIKQ